MSVRALKNDDWTFGNSKRDLLYNDDEIAQNVYTRIRSFHNDWFLDSEANIDWLNILSSKSNKQTIVNNILRVTEETDGVRRVTRLDVTVIERDAQIALEFLTINNTQFNQEIII